MRKDTHSFIVTVGILFHSPSHDDNEQHSMQFQQIHHPLHRSELSLSYLHHWAKVHNIKQISQTLIYLRDHDIRDMDELAKRAGESSAKFTELSQMIKDAEKRLAELLQKKKDAYAEYRSIKEESCPLNCAPVL